MKKKRERRVATALRCIGCSRFLFACYAVVVVVPFALLPVQRSLTAFLTSEGTHQLAARAGATKCRGGRGGGLLLPNSINHDASLGRHPLRPSQLLSLRSQATDEMDTWVSRQEEAEEDEEDEKDEEDKEEVESIASGRRANLTTAELAELNTLAKRGKIAEARVYAQKLQAELGKNVRSTSGRTVFNTLLKACVYSGNVDAAKTVYAEMMEEGIIPNNRTFGKLIHVAARARDVEQAEAWFKDSLEHSPEPHMITIATLVRACTDVQDVERAEFWVNEMEKFGLQMNRYTYVHLISAYTKSRRYSEADAWLQRARDAGYTSAAWVATFTIESLLRGSAENNIDAAAALLKARLSGEDPGEVDEFTFAALMSGYAELQRTADVMHWWQVAIDAGAVPNAAMYTAVLQSASRAADTSLAVEWFQRAAAAGIALDVYSYGTMITAFSRADDVGGVELWFRKCLQAGIQPSSFIVHSILMAYGRRGELKKSFRFFDMMIANGFVPLAKSYQHILEALANTQCSRRQAYMAVDRVLTSMRVANVKANDAFKRLLLEMVGPDAAMQLVQKHRWQLSS